MKLTALQVTMIQHRLDVPDAMAEVLADDLDVTYETARDLVEENGPGLIAKLEQDEELNPVERALCEDIATDRTFADSAECAIGDHWPEDHDPIMSEQRARAIARSADELEEKLKS